MAEQQGGLEQAGANRVIPIVPENVLGGVESFASSGVLFVGMLQRGLKPEDKAVVFGCTMLLVSLTITFLLSLYLKLRRRFSVDGGFFIYADGLSAFGFAAVVAACVMLSINKNLHAGINTAAICVAAFACVITAIKPMMR